MRHPVKRGAVHDPIPPDDVLADPTVTTGPPPSGDVVPVDLMPRHLRQARLALLVEGVVLLGWGVWGLIAALANPHAGVSGPTVLGVQLTWPHAVILMVTGVLAVLVGVSYRWTLRFTVLQAVGYGVLFLVGAGHHNWFADPANDLLHGILALVGLALLLWTAVRGMTGFGWTRRRGSDR